MATEKRPIDANLLMDTVEGVNWYHIDKMGYLANGANSQLHTPLFKAEDILNAIRNAPTVDAVEVVHGRWEPELMPTGIECTWIAEMTVQALSCSVCGKCVDVSEGYFLYCPNCGAKMDGDGNDI